MKKIILITAALIVLVCCTLFLAFYPDTNALSASPTSIRIERDTMNLGTMKYGSKQMLVFRITNIGDQPLFIRDVRPSCGCTGVDWEKRPVSPKGIVEIKVVFEPASLGRFFKSIDVLCNTEAHVHQLYLRGDVIE